MSNIVKIQQQGKHKQFFITIPKGIALAYGLEKGLKLQYRINDKGKLELLKI